LKILKICLNAHFVAKDFSLSEGMEQKKGTVLLL